MTKYIILYYKSNCGKFKYLNFKHIEKIDIEKFRFFHLKKINKF